jgi:hypothetical protein
MQNGQAISRTPAAAVPDLIAAAGKTRGLKGRSIASTIAARLSLDDWTNQACNR